MALPMPSAAPEVKSVSEPLSPPLEIPVTELSPSAAQDVIPEDLPVPQPVEIPAAMPPPSAAQGVVPAILPTPQRIEVPMAQPLLTAAVSVNPPSETTSPGFPINSPVQGTAPAKPAAKAVTPNASVQAMPLEKRDEPLIVLPPMDIILAEAKEIVAPGLTPLPVQTNSQPLPPEQPMPKAVTLPDASTAPISRPVVQETAPAPASPVKPRPFQLVNPIRRQENRPPESFPAPERSEPRPPVVQGIPVTQTNPVVPAPILGANVTPQITIEKRGPVSSRAGESMQFTIVLRNVGITPANQVRVEDEIPPGTRVVFADPQPVVQSDRTVWVIPVLPAGAEKRLKIELEAQGGGDLVGTTSAMVSVAAGIRIRVEATRIEQGRLSLVVKGTAPVPAGFPVVFEIVATNHGKQALTGLVLHGSLPAGLTHPAGKEIEADIGELGPGATKSYKIPVTAVEAGHHTIEVKIMAPNGLEAGGQGNVQVTQANAAGLSIRQSPSVRLFLDREAELRIEVTNHQAQGLTNVAVLDSLPEGVEFIAASDQGLFRPDARMVHWLIDYLAPAQTKTLRLRVEAKAAGQFANAVAARTEAQQEIQSVAKVQVEGISDLVVKISDRENPIEVGKAAMYEIKVTNQGSAPATGVQVQATLSDGMAPSQARGPTNHRVEGRQIIFASLPRLQPQGQAIYYVSALAQAPGDQRFSAQVVSDQDGSPIAREERTFVYRD
ncbi:MAG TPA: hypothetical protein VNX28_16455 [Gemmataceae bacterium]|nr:hypothetical protein [Gemmataceae bacterium]